ncbi:1-deoxy-D-xylulose-5-phosphate synthase [Propionibacterium australiense]|uniref:1-deoxy-D-xylulose-5-phosphate synthase n=1 Tax=Propionibacterium australiense TaxID=119981 RepID=A0A383S8Q1_9ACTN|nr:1-deoxy-D-xylulose-5-phosphate synthase [Propionibacterium australiense]RLP06886.1 1-deoxy-D-xylulose-5-phosphate synthase [Propionibacterium australiense]RLP08843.1 1-deoxy-D-xylulose-5-phosphate synthase [Propionibacterium australiense]SYZ34348.1 1-deoxy-D-xylulose-5-phosphate synthase [Propionibacterium australiense]VEH90059.1 1-deoxy-D-xylulose-5-phosphate synthase [Propionibacterium australiense]
MALLDRIREPSDLRTLSDEELRALADEIRRFLVTNVARTGGHLGPNLGVVELTMAIHMVFDSPKDPIVFDVGHQSYVHKILTGRAAEFGALRQKGGLSGYPNRDESEHDWVENSHASAGLSWSEGMARAFRLTGRANRTVVTVVGDGALTGGMAWEALNNIAADPGLPMVIVVNDNGRSYSPTVGGLSRQLSGLRTDPRYEKAMENVKTTVSRAPLVGRPAYDLLHGLKIGLKDVLAPQGLFSDLGLKYIGPIDGHDLQALVVAMGQAKGFGGPVIVHAITQKGKGFAPAENHERDFFHAIGRINECTGEPLTPSVQATWTDAFGAELVELGAERDDLVAITAAMLHPVGLGRFAAAYPDRVFDVGIAEQHAMGLAAGLARAGLHPVVAVYSSFLNRAFDQLLLDVGMHRLGVTVVLDRAGVTGPDGPSHDGVWDCSIVGIVPGVHLASPRDEVRLREALRQSVGIEDAPSVIRYSKEKLPDPIEAVASSDGIDVLAAGERPEVLVIGYGQLAGTALAVARALEGRGLSVTVADPLWSLPVTDALLQLVAQYSLVATIEDNQVVGGVGSQLQLAMNARGVNVPVRQFGVPQEYLPVGSRAEVLADIGLTAERIAESVAASWAGLGHGLS